MSNFSEYSYNYFERCVNCGNTEFRQMGKGTDRTNKFHKQVVECKNCKLLFTNPIADRRSMQLYYSTYGSTHPRALDISQKQMLFAKEVTEQFSNAEKCLRFLDVGAASGEIMQSFKMHISVKIKGEIWGVLRSFQVFNKICSLEKIGTKINSCL